MFPLRFNIVFLLFFLHLRALFEFILHRKALAADFIAEHEFMRNKLTLGPLNRIRN